jgi:hypothetical protein
MKRNTSIILAIVAVCLSFAARTDAAYVYHPTPNDLSDLPHAEYFTWGINFTLPQDEVITGAILTFNNIWDWRVEQNDRLYIHLLDNTNPGSISYVDNQGGGDNFAGQGITIGVWSDSVGGHPRNFNLVYNFAAMGLLETLNTYAATAPAGGKVNFGFGLDPDCHFFNNGVTFSITTGPSNGVNPIPEPATVTLLGLAGLFLVGRRKKTV